MSGATGAIVVAAIANAIKASGAIIKMEPQEFTKIINKSEHFSFNESFIHKIAQLGRNIQKHYKQPMDIEFAIKDNKPFILQARPITTL